MNDATEVKIPLGLIALSMVLLVVSAAVDDDAEGFGAHLLALLVVAAVQVAISLVACFIAAGLAGIAYGLLKTAIIKLTAIILVAGALDTLLPLPGLIGSLVIFISTWYVLLWWLFDLDSSDIWITIAVLIVIRMAFVFCLLASLLSLV